MGHKKRVFEVYSVYFSCIVFIVLFFLCLIFVFMVLITPAPVLVKGVFIFQAVCYGISFLFMSKLTLGLARDIIELDKELSRLNH